MSRNLPENFDDDEQSADKVNQPDMPERPTSAEMEIEHLDDAEAIVDDEEDEEFSLERLSQAYAKVLNSESAESTDVASGAVDRHAHPAAVETSRNRSEIG